MTPLAKDLRAALEFLGPNGEHWGKGSYGNEKRGFCMAGACVAAKGNSFAESKLMREFLDILTGGCAESFNDEPGRTFSEVREVFEKSNCGGCMTPLESLIQLVIAHPEKIRECMELAFDYGRCEEAQLSELPPLSYSDDYLEYQA